MFADLLAPVKSSHCAWQGCHGNRKAEQSELGLTFGTCNEGEEREGRSLDKNTKARFGVMLLICP